MQPRRVARGKWTHTKVKGRWKRKRVEGPQWCKTRRDCHEGRRRKRTPWRQTSSSSYLIQSETPQIYSKSHLIKGVSSSSLSSSKRIWKHDNDDWKQPSYYFIYYFLNRQKEKREFFFWPCVSRRDLLRVRHVCVCIISCLLFLIGRFLFDKTQFVPPPFRLPTASLSFFLSWIEIGRLLLPFGGGRVWCWLHSIIFFSLPHQLS